MPELPDVAVLKQYLDATSLHQRISQIEVFHKKIVRSVSPEKLSQILKGRKLKASHRHGKLLFSKLNTCHGWLVFHFGMTGFLTYRKDSEKVLGDHIRFMLKFSNGSRLGFDCQRVLGWVDWIADLPNYLQDHKLGPDALAISESDFVRRFQKTRGLIKTSLMKQSNLAGIGNVYADEILYKAAIHPQLPVTSLNHALLRRVYRATQSVLKRAIHYRANPQKMPKSWLLLHRQSGSSCPRCGNPITRIVIHQRSSYFCKKCQRKVH